MEHRIYSNNYLVEWPEKIFGVFLEVFGKTKKIEIMEEQQILDHIRQRESEKAFYGCLLEELEEWNLSEKTLKEIKAIGSSKIAQCERSIRDHQKLLS